MRELTIQEMEVVSGGITEQQCAAAFTGAGALLGFLGSGGNLAASMAVGFFGGIAGGVLCADLIESLDGDE